MKNTERTSKNYFAFSTFGFSKIIDSILERKRNEILNIFFDQVKPQKNEALLDVGVSAEDHPSSNLLEKKYPYLEKLTALSEENHKVLEDIYPGLTFVLGDGRSLPFEDNSFDNVYSHAVIEHVGSRENQLQFISELYRVSKRSVFITTPNRWHIFEFHTGFPFIHFLPALIYRFIYKILGKGMYATEESLNLLDTSNLKELAKSLNVRSFKVIYTRFLFMKSNLVLLIEK